MTFFLHYHPQSDFGQGIFVPYATQAEAERQAAYDVLNGVDDEIFVAVFKEDYAVPKFGWTQEHLTQASEMPHLDSDRQKQGRVHTRKQLLATLNQHMEDLHREEAAGHTDFLLARHADIMAGKGLKASVPGNAYNWMTGGTATASAAALAAATAKTLVLITGGTANQPAIVEVGVSFDGVTSSAVPVLVELVSGTGGTAGTPRAALASGKQLRGWPAQVSATTCADTYTVEPGVQLVNRKWLVSPNGGLLVIQFPMGREPTGIVTAATDAKTWSIRATAPAIVNAHAYIEYEE